MPKFRGTIINNRLYVDVIVTQTDKDLTPNNVLSMNYKFKALIDTGASQTAITSNVSEKLKLISRGKKDVVTASKKESVNVYQVYVTLPILENQPIVNEGKIEGVNTSIHLKSHALEVSELRFQPDDFDVLLGMDIIKLGVLIVDTDSFIFTF